MLTILLATLSPLLAPQENDAGPPVLVHPDVGDVHRFLEWPEADGPPDTWATAGDFSEAGVGRFSQVGVSYAVIKGKEVFLVEGIETIQALSRLNPRSNKNLNKVEAIAVTGDEGADSRGSIMTAGTRYGLVQSRWQPSTGDYLSVIVDSTREAKLITSMRCVDIDDTGHTRDLIAASENTVRVYRRQSSSWVQGTTVVATETVQDAILLDYDGDGLNEIACLTSSVEVYDLDGTLVADIDPNGTIWAITSVPPMPSTSQAPADVCDRLVIAYKDGPDSKLDIRDVDGLAQPTITLFAPAIEGEDGVELLVTWLMNGDVNNDGRSDILMSITNAPCTIALKRALDGTYSVDEDYLRHIYLEANPGNQQVNGNVAQPVFWTAGPYSRNTVITAVSSLGHYILDGPNSGTDDRTGISISTTPSTVAVDPNVFPSTVGDSGGPEIHVVKYSKAYFDLTLRLSPPAGTIVSPTTFAVVQLWKEEENSPSLVPSGGHAWLPLDGNLVGNTSNRYEIVVPWDLIPGAPAAPTTPVIGDNPIYWVYVQIIDVSIQLMIPGQPWTYVSSTINDESEFTHVAIRMQPSDPEPGPEYYQDVIANLTSLVTLKRLINPDHGTGGSVEYGIVGVTEIGGAWQLGVEPSLPATPWPYVLNN